MKPTNEAIDAILDNLLKPSHPSFPGAIARKKSVAKAAVLQLLKKQDKESRIDENEKHLENLDHKEAMSYSVRKIKDRIATLKSQGGK